MYKRKFSGIGCAGPPVIENNELAEFKVIAEDGSVITFTASNLSVAGLGQTLKNLTDPRRRGNQERILGKRLSDGKFEFIDPKDISLD